MRYLDRSGQPINSLEWMKLYRQPHYAILRRNLFTTHELITSWIGVASEQEQAPLIFFVELKPLEKKQSPIGKQGYVPELSPTRRLEIWCPDEATALAAHEELYAELNPIAAKKTR
jgi:hypothetical protein